MGLSEVCDCGISRLYSLTIFERQVELENVGATEILTVSLSTLSLGNTLEVYSRLSIAEAIHYKKL